MAKKRLESSGFPEPNYTEVPNQFFEMLSDKNMTESEIRVTLIMLRNTFGWHQQGFKMSIRKLAEASGLSYNSASAGAEAAELRGTFRRTNPDEDRKQSEWELIIQDESASNVAASTIEADPFKTASTIEADLPQPLRHCQRLKKEINNINKDIAFSDNIITPSKNPKGKNNNSSELEATSKWELYLMDILTKEAAARRGGAVRPFKKFKSLENKRIFEAAEARLGDDMKEAIRCAMAAGRTSIESAVNYINVYKKDRYPASRQNGQPVIAPAQTKTPAEVHAENMRLNSHLRKD